MPTTEADLTYCTRCGCEQVPPGAGRCPRCEKDLTAPVTIKLCPMCGGGGSRVRPGTGEVEKCPQCQGTGRVPG